MRTLLLPTVTTIGQWRSKIDEVRKLKLSQVAFFPTCLNFSERQEAYGLLAEIDGLNIPFVHLRSDMTPTEIRELMKRFQTKVFNIHATSDYPLNYDLSEFRTQIYVENNRQWDLSADVEDWAGLCLDTAHLEDARQHQPAAYRSQCRLLDAYPIGCAHISAIGRPYLKHNQSHSDSHHFADLSEFDYLKRYQRWLPVIAALELENTIVEQLQVKKYIEAEILE